jgi:hypothetical protein
MVALLTILAAEPVWAQCAMCRTALTESAEGQQLAQGFNRGILFLLAAPYLVFGTLVGSIWIVRRRNVARVLEKSLPPSA